MNSFKLLLEKFDVTLRKYNLDNYKKLQPPLPENEIDNYLNELGVKNENFKLLFRWTNGFDCSQGEKTRSKIFDRGALLSLEYITELTNDDIDIWKKTFVPLVSTGDGDYLLFNNKKGKDYGKLHLYSVAALFIDNPVSFYDSIYAMIETTIKAYEKKILVYDANENWLDENFEEFHKLGKKYNKLSDFWKLD